MKIRALTVLIDLNALKEDLDSFTSKLVENVDEASRKLGVEIWTIRLAVTPQPINRLNEVCKFLDENVCEKVNYINIPLKASHDNDPNIVFKVLSSYKRIFTCLNGGLNELDLFRKLLRITLDSSNYEIFVKFSFSPKSHVTTPYFPSATAIKGEIGISAALLYVDDLIKTVESNGNLKGRINECYQNTIKILNYISKEMKIENFGVDLSLSPWLNESVAKLIEKITGIEFNNPKTHYGIFKINNLLKEISNKTKTIGFNEVMLPYAEDSRLMELGAKGKLTAYDLLSYSPICVAGFDVAVLPKMNDKTLKSLLLDTYSILTSKNRPSGIRIILTHNQWGEIADLGFLGKAPVMKLK